ncbi:MAG: hypothetical protein FWD66_10965 [Paludibacter sp.]|nr:hypothetical protein [Paludibacter sp.]
MKQYIFYIFIIILFFSCGNKQNESDAQAKFSEIEQLVNAGKYNAAKIALDSFHINFSEMISFRHKALALEDTLSMRQNRRIITFCDSMLVINEKKIDSLHTFFSFQKDEKFQVFGNYIYYKQTQNANIGNTFRAYIDENNDFFIVKNFFGGLPKNCSIALKVSFGDLYSTTDTIPKNSPARYQFEADGKIIESLTLKNEQIEKFAAFINQFSQNDLFVNYVNSGRYQLSNNEKEIISVSYQFWKLQKEIENLKTQKNKAVKKTIAVLSPSTQN